MVVRLRKSFRTRVHSLNPKTFAFFFVESKRNELIALRGRQTDMFFVLQFVVSSFFPAFRGSVGGLKGGGDVGSRG
jgi:hypothetical protein